MKSIVILRLERSCTTGKVIEILKVMEITAKERTGGKEKERGGE